MFTVTITELDVLNGIASEEDFVEMGVSSLAKYLIDTPRRRSISVRWKAEKASKTLLFEFMFTKNNPDNEVAFNWFTTSMTGWPYDHLESKIPRILQNRLADRDKLEAALWQVNDWLVWAKN
jgi:hypothetical protein